MKLARTAAGAAVVVLAFACGAVQGTPLTEAPRNICGGDLFPCERYVVKDLAAQPQCNVDEATQRSRCDVGRPDYAFTMVLSLPNSSIYAPGRTLVMTSNVLTAQTGSTMPCKGVSGTTLCVLAPKMVAVEGTYRATEAVASVLGATLGGRPSIPVRVRYVPLTPDSGDEALNAGLPLAAIFTSTRLIVQADSLPPLLQYRDTVSVGRQLRIAYPEPPFDAFFPPVFTPFTVSNGVLDDVLLGLDTEQQTTPLDDQTGRSREVSIKRTDGLDGWRAWLIDAKTRRRISTTKPLKGTNDAVVLHTIGWNRSEFPQPSVQDSFLIVAPPDGFLGIPTLESAVVNGIGLSVEIPVLPAPTPLRGVIAHGEGPQLIGIPSRVLFSSTGLRIFGGLSRGFLKYETTVTTDERGRFATVLPPGFYNVTIEPDERSGYSKVMQTLDTTITTAQTFFPPVRSHASGHVVLADGRPVSEAEIIALPSFAKVEPNAVAAAKPRPAHARTDRDGNFSFDIDQGLYDLQISPAAGTDFPWVVQVRSFGTGNVEIGEIVVPPPARIAFVLRAPGDFQNLQNPIQRGTVRVYAELPGRGPPAVEIGRGVTGEDGRVEILLAPRPR